MCWFGDSEEQEGFASGFSLQKVSAVQVWDQGGITLNVRDTPALAGGEEKSPKICTSFSPFSPVF